MKDQWVATIWICFFVCISFLIHTYISWCKEYDSKIISITRNTYHVKFENGKSIFITEDQKEM